MAAPKFLGGYLVGRPRLVFKYVFQSADTTECDSDTDWAGCPKTRKRTSGWVIFAGGAHLEDVFFDSAHSELVQRRG